MELKVVLFIGISILLVLINRMAPNKVNAKGKSNGLRDLNRDVNLNPSSMRNPNSFQRND